MPVMTFLFDMWIKRKPHRCIHLHLLTKKSEIINYTWVTGSEQPPGAVLSSGEIDSVVGQQATVNPL